MADTILCRFGDVFYSLAGQHHDSVPVAANEIARADQRVSNFDWFLDTVQSQPLFARSLNRMAATKHREFRFFERLQITHPPIDIHAHDELAHYATAAEDVEFLFPFGWQEIEGIHDRGDWDLSRHTEYSGKDLSFTDPVSKENFTPMVIETTMGVDRTCLALLVNVYEEEDLGDGDTRKVMHFTPAMAPIKVAVLPLSKKLAEPARELERELRRHWNCAYDESGNIGRRYRRQDEVGTPFCVTFDFDSVEDGQVTVRDRDSMDQERVAADDLVEVLRRRLEDAR